MKLRIDDLRINGEQQLIPPKKLIEDIPISEKAAQTVHAARNTVHNMLAGADKRLLVLVGPCSIHDTDSAMEYATQLKALADRYLDTLTVVMRCYFEKPRTTIGWKGFINDPYLDGSCAVNDGFRLSRKLLADINALGLPTGTEYLDEITPQYLADLVSWAAIGARTVESQTHRQLASGLSCPVGFKNSTDGNITVAIDAVQSARHPHTFLSTTKDGAVAIFSSTGNNDCHVILRGGGGKTNYDRTAVTRTIQQLRKRHLTPAIMIDCSHANSNKQYERQAIVAEDVAAQIAGGEQHIFGVMIEIHLVAGNQPIAADKSTLTYGQSITDACIDMHTTETLFDTLSNAVTARKSATT